MRTQLKVLLITGSLLTASLGAAVSAAAASVPPVMDTSIFACNNGVCEVGPGNVGMPFAAVLNVKTGTVTSPFGEAEFGDEFTMKVISGSLPPGLKLSLPSTAWTVTGTPTKAGTYPFTVQITPTPDAGGGPSGTQQLTITIGTGSSDRLVVTGAGFNGHLFLLSVGVYDVNISALYSVSVTSTGKAIIPAQADSASQDGLMTLTEHPDDPCGQTSCNLTVTDSLGSSVTVTLPPPKY